MLTALLPVPKFIHKNKRMQSLLEDRLIHQCLDIVLEPVKQAACLGIMLPDPLGYKRYCFTPIVSYIADTPEAAMLATVGGKTSPLTMAMYKQFRDPFRHEPHTASTTLAQLAVVKSKVDPSDIKAYLREAQQFRLNGVHEPFWRNAALCCPSIFLTPEILHYLHKFFWDHDVKWCLQIVGDAEIDFRLSVLQPTAGFRHFKGGISKLKQVTGCVHRDVQHYIVGIIAGAAPREILCAIRALMDFCYRVQSYLINDDDLQQISTALDEFHRHKQAVLNFGACRGKGSRIIDNWYIPKLELMQSFVPSIRNIGVAIQWTADVTEHAHVTEIKTPAEASNNHNYDPQICRYLHRSEKCRMFELATSLTESNAASHGIMQGGLTAEESDSDGDEDTTCIKGVGLARPITNYFSIATSLTSKGPGSIPLPLWSFTANGTAINLSYDPSLRRTNIDDVAEKFGLPDLCVALAHYLHCEQTYGSSYSHPISGRCRGTSYPALPFTEVQVWFKVRLQNTAVHDAAEVLPQQTLHCSPPCDTWTLGHYDAAVFNADNSAAWPADGPKGM